MLEQTVQNTIRQHSMIQHGEFVIVALSGGADSMALFHFLLQSREELGIQLAAAHFEHGLRGDESLQDAALVQRYCEEKGVQLFLAHGEMGGKKPPRGQSVEEWARKLRYGFLEGLAAQHGAKIATAHSLDDNAETVLFHAARGTSTRGLGGIPPVRGVFIRPLRYTTRAEVEEYCKVNQLAFATDATNADVSFARNRIRLQVLPGLEAVQPGAKAALNRLADDMRELDGWLEEQAMALLCKAERHTPYSKGYDIPTLQAAPAPLRSKAISLLLGRSATWQDVQQLGFVLAGKRAAHQPSALVVARRYKSLLVLEPVGEPAASYQLPLENGEFCLAGGYRLRVSFEPFDRNCVKNGCDREKSDKKGLTFSADYDKIPRYSVWRTRQPKDVFAPPGGGGTKTLKKWMNEAGVPRSMRYQLPLLAHGDTVLWAYGPGFAKGLAVGKNTKTVLWVQVVNTNKE